MILNIMSKYKVQITIEINCEIKFLLIYMCSNVNKYSCF